MTLKTKRTPRPIQSYSVLLLYPDYIADTFGETYYDFVRARSPRQAVKISQTRCVSSNELNADPNDFVCLLVTKGHNQGLWP